MLDETSFHWNLLDDATQLLLAREAIRRAACTIAEQAQALAHEMEDRRIEDRGGPDALRLLAAIIDAGRQELPIGTDELD